MTKLKISAVSAAALLGLSACGVAGDRVKDRVADRVHGYCETTTKIEQEATRVRVDDITEPHQIRIHCDRDGD